MNIRQARKIMSGRTPSRMRRRLSKLYPPYENELGTVYPSWHMYHRIHKAYIVMFRKVRKYGDKFRKL